MLPDTISLDQVTKDQIAQLKNDPERFAGLINDLLQKAKIEATATAGESTAASDLVKHPKNSHYQFAADCTHLEPWKNLTDDAKVSGTCIHIDAKAPDHFGAVFGTLRANGLISREGPGHGLLRKNVTMHFGTNYEAFIGMEAFNGKGNVASSEPEGRSQQQVSDLSTVATFDFIGDKVAKRKRPTAKGKSKPKTKKPPAQQLRAATSVLKRNTKTPKREKESNTRIGKRGASKDKKPSR